MSSKELERVAKMVDGYRQTCLITAALQCGLIDRLGEGVATAPELSEGLGLDPGGLKRLLRALKCLDLVSCDERGSYSLSTAGGYLQRTGFGAGLRAWAELVGGEYYRAWAGLAQSLKTDESAFQCEFGMDVWEHRRRHGHLNEAFQRVASGEQRRTLSRLLRAYDFPPTALIVDVGGGRGELLGGILKKYPEARGVLLDLPQAVCDLELEGVEVVPGSFFDGVPAGGDCYLLKHVLHNWDDEHCVSILKNCRKAAHPDGRILILENLLQEDDGAHVLMDIHMMAVLGGRERTESEYVDLLKQAGLELVQTSPLGLGLPVLMEAKIVS